MGIPIIAVTELMGSVVCIPGNCETISLKSITILPVKITAGTSTKWFEVLKITLQMCGTAIPIKPIGPQNAVIVPASKLVLKKMTILLEIILTPNERA